MSTHIIKRRQIDEAVYALLRDNLNFNVYELHLPAGEMMHMIDKYALVQPVDGVGALEGPPLAAPEADATLEYDVKCVGRDDRQASWVADEVRRVMTGRSNTGGLLHDLLIEGHDADDRWSPGPIGAPKLESGVYQVLDSYRVRVSRT